MALSEHCDKRLASLHFSAMRVTNATTFRASTRSTSHTTIVVLNIFGPSTLQLPFLYEYLSQECSIPWCDERRRLKRRASNAGHADLDPQSPQFCCSETLHTVTQELPTWKNRLARGAARDRQLLCQRRRRIPLFLFANRPTESLVVTLRGRMSPLLECAT
jgi:hypothetical protein